MAEWQKDSGMRPLLAWTLYWFGDLAERLGVGTAYQWLMNAAYRVSPGAIWPE